MKIDWIFLYLLLFQIYLLIKSPVRNYIYSYSSISQKSISLQPWFDENRRNRIPEIWKTRESSNESSLRGEQKPLYTDPISTFIGELGGWLQWFIGLIEKNEVYSLLGINPLRSILSITFEGRGRNWITFSTLFTGLENLRRIFANWNETKIRYFQTYLKITIIFYYYFRNAWTFN